MLKGRRDTRLAAAIGSLAVILLAGIPVGKSPRKG